MRKPAAQEFRQCFYCRAEFTVAADGVTKLNQDGSVHVCPGTRPREGRTKNAILGFYERRGKR